MDPVFGVGIPRFLFEPNDSNTLDNVATKIQEQAGKYLPYLSIETINMDNTTNENALYLNIVYTIVPLSVKDLLSLPVNTK